MTTPITMADVHEAILEAMADVPTQAGSQCRAAFPHPNLVYRGKGVYHCPCGKVYRKDGEGGLE